MHLISRHFQTPAATSSVPQKDDEGKENANCDSTVIEKESPTQSKEEELEDLELSKLDDGFIPEIVRVLRDYDAQEKQRIFEKTLFHCLVCFAEKLGQECLKFAGVI